MTEASQPAASPQLQATYQKVLRQFDEMTEMANSPDDALGLRVEGVSLWSVGQHLDHMAVAAKGMLTAIFMLLGSPKAATEGEPAFAGRIVLWTGYIPRGKGKSPDAVLPKSQTPDEIRKNIQMVQGFVKGIEAKLGQIEACKGKTPHPALGSFTAAQWVRFIDIHNYHHFKIIRDIRKKA